MTKNNLLRALPKHVKLPIFVASVFKAHDKIKNEEKIEDRKPPMSKLTSLFLIIIFFICLFLGIILGRCTPPPPQTITPTVTETKEEPTRILSVLFLGMSNFDDEEIYLESAWISTITNSSQNGRDSIEVVLVNLYPPSAGQVTNPAQSQYVLPHDPIIFPKDYLENLQAFEILNTIPVLNRSDIFFKDVVVLDEYAMNYIIELTNTNPQLPPPPITGESFCKPWEDPQHTHDVQHTILELLCAPPQNILKYTNFAHVFDLIPTHLDSTLTQEEILGLWQVNVSLENPPLISCQIFP